VLLQAHIENALETFKAPTVENLASAFRRLFGEDLPPLVSISDPIKFNWIHNGSQMEVTISDVATLTDLSRLFYGLRCVFAHGRAQPTLSGGGALARELGSLDVNCPPASSYCKVLHSRIRQHGKTTDISYLLLANLQRFIQRVAHRTMTVIGRYLAQKRGLPVWSAEPQAADEAEGVGELFQAAQG
jgi:hypothetical protein